MYIFYRFYVQSCLCSIVSVFHGVHVPPCLVQRVYNSIHISYSVNVPPCLCSIHIVSVHISYSVNVPPCLCSVHIMSVHISYSVNVPPCLCLIHIVSVHISYSVNVPPCLCSIHFMSVHITYSVNVPPCLIRVCSIHIVSVHIPSSVNVPKCLCFIDIVPVHISMFHPTYVLSCLCSSVPLVQCFFIHSRLCSTVGYSSVSLSEFHNACVPLPLFHGVHFTPRLCSTMCIIDRAYVSFLSMVHCIHFQLCYLLFYF